MKNIPENFTLTESFRLYDVPCEMYTAKNGLRVYHVKLSDSPTINSYISLNTEINDDSGIPHCIEHMVFLGSKKYPFKGFLDNLANRSSAQGTNASTSTSTTSYEFSTVSPDSLYRFLPVYLDHIFHPSLDADLFKTEIHHVDSNGYDTGVVYNEMTAIINNLMMKLNDSLLRSLFEGSSCASETGGLPSEIRKLTVERLREYHSKYYVANNCVVLIVGCCDTAKVLESLDQELPVNDLERPFFSTIPKQFPLKPNTIKRVPYPSPEDQESTDIFFGFNIGHTLTKDAFLAAQAIHFILNWASHSAASVFQKEFLYEDNLCNDIDVSVELGLNGHAGVWFQDVALEDIDTLIEKFNDVSRNLEINYQELRDLIEWDTQNSLLSLENSPVESFVDLASNIFDIPLDDLEKSYIKKFTSYISPGKSDAVHITDWEATRIRDFLVVQSDSWWNEVWNNFINTLQVTLVGEPSSELADENRNQADEQRQINLKEAVCEDLVAPNQEEEAAKLVATFPILANAKSVNIPSFITGYYSSSYGPTRLYLHDDLNFANVRWLFDLSSLSFDDKALIPLFLSCIFELPLVESSRGPAMTKEQFDNRIKQLTATYHVGNDALCGAGADSLFPDLFGLGFQASLDKLDDAMKLAYRGFMDTQFTREDVINNINNLLKNTADKNRQSQILRAIFAYESYTHDSYLTLHIWQQEVYLQALLNNPNPELVVQTAWKRFCESLKMVAILSSQKPSFLHKEIPEILYEDISAIKYAKPPREYRVIHTHPQFDSSSALFSIRLIDPAYNEKTPSPLSAAISLACTGLNLTEGPLWLAIRNAGLAYGAYFIYRRQHGTLKLMLYRCSDPMRALQAAKEATISFMETLDEDTLNVIKSGYIFEIASEIAGSAPHQFRYNLLCDIKRIAFSFEESIKSKIDITVDQLKETIKNYFLPVFENKQGIIVGTTDIEAKLDSSWTQFDMNLLKYE